MRAVLLSALMVLIAAGSDAQAAEEFYEGKTIKLLAGTSPGSGSDAFFRPIQLYYGRYIPGNPNIIIQYVPSGGGMAATNQIYNVSAKDGTELAGLNRNTVVRQLLGEKTAKFEPARLRWIGTPASYGNDAWVFMISSALPYKTFHDLRAATKPLHVAGIGSNPFEPIVRDILGVNMKFIIGYSGPQAMLAVESGEVDAFGTGLGTVKATKPDWVTGDKIRFMVQFGHKERLKTLSGVPTGQELAKNKDDIALIHLAESILAIGWPIVAPAEVPKERVAVLRDSFRQMMADQDFQGLLIKSKLDISPIYGEDLQQAIVDITKTPASVLERYKGMVEQR